MKVQHRIGLYILFASISNFVSAKEHHKDADGEWPEEANRIMRELGTKLKMWYMNKVLVDDYGQDIESITRGMSGYETTNPLTLGATLLSRYLELPKEYRIVHLSKYLVDDLILLEEQIFESGGSIEIVIKSTDASDKLVSAIKNYVERRYVR